MKKYILIAIICLISISAKSQPLPIDSVSKKITYQAVIHVDSVSKDVLYTRAREWFAKSFRSANTVLQMDDKESGKIIGKGNASGTIGIGFGMNTPIREEFTVSITVKDGRYRYEISDFSIKSTDPRYLGTFVPVEEYAFDPKWKTSKNEYKRVAKDVVNNTSRIASNMITDLISAMISGGLKSKDDF